MNQYVNNNGVLIPSTSYSIMSGNRAYLYGDGLFESIRIMNGKAINMENHFKRLVSGAAALQMRLPEKLNLEFFMSEIQTLVDENKIIEGGRVRFSFDRRAGGTYLPETSDSDYFIEAMSFRDNEYKLNTKGYSVDLYDEIKKDINPLSTHKTKNGLIYIMAKMKAKEKGLDDLLIQNYKMGIIEGGSSNLFVVSNGVLYTPGLDLGPLGGTMRMQIINLALANEIKVYECNISPQNLLVADEVFLTNAIQGVIWVDSYRTKIYSHETSIQFTKLLNDKWG